MKKNHRNMLIIAILALVTILIIVGIVFMYRSSSMQAGEKDECMNTSGNATESACDLPNNVSGWVGDALNALKRKARTGRNPQTGKEIKI